MTDEDDQPTSIHERLQDIPIREAAAADRGEDFENLEAETAFWRAQFEKERERLAKLWVAYKDLEAELEMRAQEAETVAERKVADQLAEVTEEGEAIEDAETPSPGDEVPEDEAGTPAEGADRIRIECEDTERAVEAGRGTSYGLRLVNEGSDPTQVSLEVTDVEEGWNALTSFSDLELDEGETRDLYLLVRAPEDAQPGEFCAVTLELTTRSGYERQLRTFTVVQSAGTAEAEVEESIEATEEAASQPEQIEESEEVESVEEPVEASEEGADDSEAVEEADEVEETLLDAEDFDQETLVGQTCELMLDDLDADIATAYEVQDDELVLAASAGVEISEEDPSVTETALARDVDESGGILVVDDLSSDLEAAIPQDWADPEISSAVFATVTGPSGPQMLLAAGSSQQGAFDDLDAEQVEDLVGTLASSLGVESPEPEA